VDAGCLRMDGATVRGIYPGGHISVLEQPSWDLEILSNWKT